MLTRVCINVQQQHVDILLTFFSAPWRQGREEPADVSQCFIAIEYATIVINNLCYSK